MTDAGEHRRRYGDDEIGLILKRAAELQRREPATAAEGGGGLTLDELEEIAAEAGIDARHLRRAAAELDEAGAGLRPTGTARLLGGPLSLAFERTLPGELAEAELERLIPDIQEAAESAGQVSLLARTLTWNSRTPQGERSLQVVVASRSGRTRIRIEERLSGLAGGLYGGIVGGVGGGVGLGVGLGVGIGALGSALFAVAWPVGVIGGSWLLARKIYSVAVRRRRRILRDLLDRLTEQVEAMTAGERLTSEPERGLPAPPDS